MFIKHVLRSKNSRECWNILRNYLECDIDIDIDEKFTIDNVAAKVRSTIKKGWVLDMKKHSNGWAFDYMRGFAGNDKVTIKFRNIECGGYYRGAPRPIDIAIWFKVEYKVWDGKL